MTITAVILALNNEAGIADCLNSLAWADERLVILDTRSNDRTREIAASLGARVEPHPFENFAAQRNYALELAQTDWIYFLDTDERSTPELNAEIVDILTGNSPEVGWWVPRYNYVWGAVIKHGGWYPDYQLRLIKRGFGHYDPEHQVHEIVLLDGSEGYLIHPLIHYNYATVKQFRNKQRQYVAYEADIRFKQGIHPKPWTRASLPLREFVRRYITLQGFRDGWRGFVLAILVAYYYGYVATRLLAQHLANQRQKTGEA
ncbi:MAG: glycosyltransferase family 2 protein [Chloroflexi bacterium]|nr:glycosyltransferase family 2 protein [Chloroflexota bacterium]